jgi:uncharacterized protein
MREVLITGGSDGIGLSTARLLAAEGDTRVTLVARGEPSLTAAVQSLPGSRHDYVTADLSRPDDVERIAQHVSAKRYDVLINNAGVGLYGRFADIPIDGQQRMMALNMDCLVALSHRYLQHARPGDALVNIASFLGYAPLPGSAVYSATKAFVAALTEALWWEYSGRGVLVMGFTPGVVTTRFHVAAGASAGRFPRFLIQRPEDAAASLVRALGRRRGPVVFSGSPTRLFLLVQRLIGRRASLALMGTRSPIIRRSGPENRNREANDERP